MNTFLTLLNDDLSALIHSWVVWIWLLVTVIAGISAIVIGRAYTDSTSFILSWALYLYMAFGSTMVIVLCASAASTELSYLGNALMSRGVTPLHYILAKILARLLTIQGMFFIVVLPVSFIMMHYGGHNDMEWRGILLGLTYISLLLGILVMLGVTFSTFITNLLVAVSLLSILWFTGLGVYLVSEHRGFSPEGLLGVLPLILQGSYQMGDNWLILGCLVVPILILPLLSLYLFSGRDL
jgi:hypothetical protein